MTLEESYELVDNHAGFRLSLKRISAGTAAPGTRPVLLVPGYGMNAFVFGFHPSESSLEATLAREGLEVWSAELRGQGRSQREGGSETFGLSELALDDVPPIVERVLERSATGASRVDLIGCSLGTALSFGYLAHNPKAPVHAVVAFGGLVTWVDVHPLLRVAFASPALVGRVRLKNTRAIARVALPALAKIAPPLLSIYINARSTDLSRADEMVETVEDIQPRVNEDIAHWIRRKELVLRGVNVSRALSEMRHPLLCVVAKDDGIVPEATARDVFTSIGSEDKELLVVGGGDRPIAHADLFLSRGAEASIFRPVARFLRARKGP